MFKRIAGAAAALALACTGALALAAPASATGGHYPPPEVCYGEPIHHDAVIEHHDAIPETFTTVAGPWWVWAPTVADGPQDYTPGWPSDDERGKWVGPKTEGGPDRTEEGTFNVSHGQSGNSSWFHRGPSTLVGNGDGVDAWDEVIAEAYDEDVIVPCEPDDEIIAWPFPTVTDPCGPGNATWVLPTGDGRISWVVDAGRLIGTITADGFTWPNGSLVNSWGDASTLETNVDACPPETEDYPVPAQFSAEPGDPTCEAAGAFSTAFLGEPVSSEDGVSWYDFENVWVQIDRSVEGQVYIYIGAKDGFVLTGLDPAKWNLDAMNAERTILLPEQLSGEEACPTDEPPVEEPPVVTPPVVVPPVAAPPVVVPAAAVVTPAYVYTPATLASTGSEGAPLALIAAFAALAGIALVGIRRLARR